MKVFHNAAYCDTSVAWETTRKADAVAARLSETAVVGVELVSPTSLTDVELQGVLDGT